MAKDTITFNREGIEEYKTLIAEAKSKGHSTFVRNGTLYDITSAERLIGRFEPHFKNPAIKSATIPYE